MLEYSFWVMRLVSLGKSSQYSVSAHSFNEIVAFTRNSFFLFFYWASVKFASMDVPERNSCFANTYSWFWSQVTQGDTGVLPLCFSVFKQGVFGKIFVLPLVFKELKCSCVCRGAGPVKA
jgi:hypothetical protein